MAVLVVAEHDNKSVKKATLNTVAAAQKLGSDIHVLVAGHQAGEAAKAAAQIAGVKKVLHADAPHLGEFLAENVAALVVSLAKAYSHILAPATTTGKDVMPRAAALLDVQQISDISAVESADTFVRPIYAGNALATVKSKDPIKVITVRTTAFDAVAASGGSASIENVGAPADSGLSSFVSREVSKSERPELTAAKIIVSGGRGMGSGENFTKVLEPLADRLGAAMGASRAAVDAGFVPNDWQVGQTGKIVAPDLYVAVGISGAIQHLAGMKDSRVIVAINKDEEAPIFQVADFGVVGDLFQLVPVARRGAEEMRTAYERYLAPLKDMRFVLNELAGLAEVAKLPGYQDATPDTVDAILEEASKFASEVLDPINYSGDQEGSVWKDGAVTTPKGFKQAYKQYCRAAGVRCRSTPSGAGRGCRSSSRPRSRRC